MGPIYESWRTPATWRSTNLPGRRPVTWYQLTAPGQIRLQQHIANLRRLLRSCALIAAGRDSATVTVCARRRQPTSNRQGPRIEAWCLYLRLGYCNLIDYTVRETVHYTEAAVWRRLKAMRLSRETRGVRE